jgi:hypothetical protein
MPEKSMQNEVDRNYEEFQKALPDLLKTVPGKYVVMHEGRVIESFDTFGDAVRFGHSKFGSEKYSVQEVTSHAVSLGFHSYALHQPSA